MLPASRNRTYTDGSPVVPGDLNDLQDGQISGHHGVQTLILNPLSTVIRAGGGVITYDGYDVNAVPLIAQLPLDLLVGDRILVWRAYVKDNATGPVRVNVHLRKGDATGTSSTASNTQTTAGAAGTSQILTNTETILIAAGFTYYFVIGVPSGSQITHLYRIEVDFDHPP